MRYVVGVDGGGTSCRVAIADLQGRTLGSATGGPANIRTDLQGAHANIMTALTKAAAQAGVSLDHMAEMVAVLGLAGANVGDYAERLVALLGFRDTMIVSDGRIAVQGALGQEEGAVGIIGTGSVFAGRFAGQTRLIGGWGFQIGDLGSGARLGQRLLEETLLAHDGIRPPTPLTHEILASFGGDPRALVESVVQATPGFYAGFAPLLIAAAEANDPAATAILAAGTRDVERMLDAVMVSSTQRICLLGGLAAAYAGRLGERYRTLLTPPLGDALSGAVMMAVEHARQEATTDV